MVSSSSGSHFSSSTAAVVQQQYSSTEDALRKAKRARGTARYWRQKEQEDKEYADFTAKHLQGLQQQLSIFEEGINRSTPQGASARQFPQQQQSWPRTYQLASWV